MKAKLIGVGGHGKVYRIEIADKLYAVKKVQKMKYR